MVSYACNPGTQEMEAGESESQGHPGLHLQFIVQDQSGIHETESQNKQHNKPRGKKKSSNPHPEGQGGGSNSSRKKNPLGTNSGCTKGFPCELRVLSQANCMSFLILKQITRDPAQQLSLTQPRREVKSAAGGLLPRINLGV